MITYKALHNIDLTSDSIVAKQIPPDFASFTNDYLLFARNNGSTKTYTAIDHTTQVINCVLQLVNLVVFSDAVTQAIVEQLESLSFSIANRLLRSEKDAQAIIAPMNKFIKKGSLIQAIVSDDNELDSYLYIVAKVEHSEWIDGDSLRKSFGFPTEKKNVWKSAVIPVYISEGDITLGSIRVYTDNEARYWTTSFLEVTEEKSDETNTKIAFEAVDRELRANLKKEHPRDYYVLRNSLIQAMRTPQLLNYPEYINGLVGGYSPEDTDVDTAKLKDKLLRLPDKRAFDTQFTTVPKAVSARRKLKFEPMDGIAINIDGSIEEFKTAIIAGIDEHERRILKIRCSDEMTYRAFGGKS